MAVVIDVTMPRTARLTEKSQKYLRDIKSTYDIDVETSKVIEASLENMHNRRVGDES